MKVFIDSIEDKVALLIFADEQRIYVKKNYLPKGAKEGNYLDIKFFLNKTEENKVKVNIESLIDELNPLEGDFDI